MEVDYRQLCLEYFGTTDADELKQIAEKLNTPNPRNAGRKPKFSAEAVDRMRQELQAGQSMEAIAAIYGTTRQNVSRLLNDKPQSGYTMRMTLMYRQHPCTDIDVNFLNRKISIRNRTDDLLHRAFGVNETPTWEDFEYFLEERCFPKSRGDAKELLNILGVPGYDPLAIVEKTKGRMAEDHLWVKFNYFDGNVRVRNAAN